MNILMAASEMAPFASTGNFAFEMLDLASHLRLGGHEVTVVLPFYRSVRENKALKVRKTKVKFSVPVGPAKLPCEIHEATTSAGINVLFVARDEFFDRTGLYGGEDRDYQDNAARFIFFTKAAVELARRLSPDIFHVHGWHTALGPVFVKDQNLGLPTVLTPHTLEFQGNFWSYDFALTNLADEYFSTHGLEFYGSMNFLKAGLLFADAVVLPGRRFVAEMQTPLHGCGLENVLREQSWKLEGIPDGLDEAAWPVLPSSPGAKDKARAELLAAVGLPAGGRVFLADSAATNGAGISLLLEAVDRLPSDDVRLLLLGPVKEENLQALGVATRRCPLFAHREAVDVPLLQKALAGSDFLLLPGPVEPGGELLVLALRNGVVPIAAHCGGLRQFVVDHDPVTGEGNGYVIYRESVSALCDSIHRALTASAEDHAALVSAARSADFSWRATAARHVTLYTRLIERLGRKAA